MQKTYMGIIAETLGAKEAGVWPWQFKRTSVLDWSSLHTEKALKSNYL